MNDPRDPWVYDSRSRIVAPEGKYEEKRSRFLVFFDCRMYLLVGGGERNREGARSRTPANHQPLVGLSLHMLSSLLIPLVDIWITPCAPPPTPLSRPFYTYPQREAAIYRSSIIPLYMPFFVKNVF